MQDCLSKLITSTDAVASEMDGQDDEGSGTNAEKGTNDTLSKIQEMLNTTKVQKKVLHVYIYMYVFVFYNLLCALENLFDWEARIHSL